MKRRPLAFDSMRARLTAWVAAVVVVCMAVTFLVVYDATGSRLRSEVDADLHSSAGADGVSPRVRHRAALQAGLDASVCADPGRRERHQPSRAVRLKPPRRRR